MRYELKVALNYLWARRGERFIPVTTLLTGAGVMIGVAALIITLSVMGGFEQSLKRRVLALTPQVQILSSRGSISEYAEIESRARTVAGVSGSDPFIVGQGMVSSGRGIGGVIVRGIEPTNRAVLSQWGRYVRQGSLSNLVSEHRSAGGLAEGGEKRGVRVGLGVELARKLKVKLGDPLRLVVPILSRKGGPLTTKTGRFVVGAILSSGISFPDSSMLFMQLGEAQKFFGRPGEVDGIELRLASLDETAEVTRALRQIFKPPLRVRNWIEYNRSASAGFAMLKLVYSLVLMLLIAVAAFNLVATLIMVIMEKRKDIAVLVAMGASAGDVRLIFVLKGLLVGTAGTAAGLALGAAGCFALSRYHFIHIPREIYGISTLPVAPEPWNFLWVGLASIALCLLASFYPALQASRESPVEVFRS